MRRSWAIILFVLFLPFDTAAASVSDYRAHADRAPSTSTRHITPAITQGMGPGTFTNQCGNERYLEGRFFLPRRAYRATLEFAAHCDSISDMEQVEEGPEAKFSVNSTAGLHIFRVVLRMVASDGREYARSFCSADDDGQTQVPYGTVDWQDQDGMYRFVPGRRPGDTLEEGEQTTYLIPDEDLGPDCWMVVCIRGRGVRCRIPTS